MTEQVSLDRLQLIAEIATRYYAEGMSQDEIAKLVGLSRPSISRLLVDARELGIVEIRVHQPIPTVPDLEDRLARVFRLEEVCVLERRNSSDEEVRHQVGRLTVAIVDRTLRDGMTLGLSWGTTVHAVVRELRPRRLPNVKVVQLLGGVGAPHASIDGPEQVRRAGETFGAQHYYLNAPMRVDNPDVAKALREDHSVREVLELARNTDVALVGIGSIVPVVSTQYHSGYTSYEELRRLDRMGVVGAICSSFYNLAGEYVEASWFNPCVIGVDWEDLNRFPQVIGAATGKAKAPAILGAVRSGVIDRLVIDDAAAEAVLALASK
jgi:DNA-binding transcriptional regulator LsrR (DeoR family)